MSEKLPTTDIETADAPVTEKGTFAGEKLPESDTPAYVRTPRARSEKAEAAEEFDDEIACDYCDEVIKSLCDYADGLTSTKEETACARKLRDELSHLSLIHI